MKESYLMTLFIGLASFALRELYLARKRRKEDSHLAAIYLHEILLEVQVGVGRLRHLYENGGEPERSGKYTPIMPTKNWNGPREIIPDHLYRRICLVAKSERWEEFDDLRFHLKNYYTVICKFGNDVTSGADIYDEHTARHDLDGAQMVCRLLEQAEAMMRRNSKRTLWPR